MYEVYTYKKGSATILKPIYISFNLCLLHNLLNKIKTMNYEYKHKSCIYKNFMLWKTWER